MRYSTLTQRIAGDASSAWDIHYQAQALRREGREIFLLSVGDPDFDTPRPIVEAAVSSLRRGDTHYSDVRGSLALRQAIARRSGPQVTADQVVVLAGAAAVVKLRVPSDSIAAKSWSVETLSKAVPSMSTAYRVL